MILWQETDRPPGRRADKPENRCMSQGRLTHHDLAHLPQEQRWELLEGVPYAMASPPTIHQLLSGQLFGQFFQYFAGKTCQALAAPMDVRLSDFDVVQPDLLVVCRPEQLQPTHIAGQPRLIVEILSASTTRHDRIRKMNLYAASGVEEYWLVSPQHAMVEVFHLREQHYVLRGSYDDSHEVVASPSFPDLEIRLNDLFGSLPEEARETSPHYEVQAALL